MLWLFSGLTLLLGLLLTRLPVFLSIGLLAFVLLFSTLLTAPGNLGRAASMALLYALALGLLVPLGDYAQRSSRVAPARKKRNKGDDKARASGVLPIDALEIPDYEVLEKVGSGGMASVYRARRKSDGGIYALKIPMEQYVADAKFIRRFHREAEVAQRLDHVNIVRTFEHGALGVKHYMVMEFVDGRSLESYVEGGELDIGLSIEVMRFVVGALQHIHSAGIIHRDIKPANIMILRSGLKRGQQPQVAANAVKLMDFGIAGGKVLTRLTMTGARVGTPIYMSPEQARGLKIDHRSDIYSLGLVFYEMLTGQTAFKGGYEAIVHQQIFQTPPPPRQINLQIPKAIDTLIMQMIAKEPDERPTLDEVLVALEADNVQDAPETDLPSRLVVSVNARQGVLRVLDTNGNLHSSLGDIGVGEGRFSAAPLSVALDGEGNYYLSIFEYRVGQESGNMIYKLNPEGKIVLAFGSYGMKAGEFLYPASLSVAANGSIYVLDSETHFVQRFDMQGRTLGQFGGRGKGKGTFNDPKSVVAGANGLVYVLDYGNRQIQRFDAAGTYQTRWAFKMGAESDGVRLLDGFTVDTFDNLYISDSTGGKIRKITPKGKVTVSYAVDPLQGEVSDSLLDLGVDDAGFLYAARRGGHTIRKYDLSGRLMTTLETYAPVVQMIVDIKQRTPAPPINASLRQG